MTRKPKEQRRIGFGKLAYQSLAELWSFQLMVSFFLLVLVTLFNRFTFNLASFGGGAMTSADLKAVVLNWRFPVLLVFVILFILLELVIEIFAQIHLDNDILQGNRGGFFHEIRAGFRSLRRFFTPAGILVLLYIVIGLPLCGIGFTISLTKSFKIPNFINEVIQTTPLYAVGYWAGIIFLIWLGVRSIFTVHGVLIDDLTPSEARRQSVRLIKANRKKFILGLIRLVILQSLIVGAIYVVFILLQEEVITPLGQELPHGYYIDVMSYSSVEDIPEEEQMIMMYRGICAFSVLVGSYMSAVVAMLCLSYFMLRITRFYYDFTGKSTGDWLERPRKYHYFTKVFLILLIFILIAVASFVIGVSYNKLFSREEPVRIVAHRAGGKLASENSIQGLETAIEHHCYGSEIDVQRTADGFYVINHDNTFKRLTGVDRAPKDMTLKEIRKLRIKDTTGNGEEHRVVRFDKMLDVIKDKEILYIELKGVTADRQMVDDVVEIVRKHDCVDDVALISLNYSIIDYAERTYPEFVTGTLFFAGFGDVTKLNCDLMIMEEGQASQDRDDQVHKGERGHRLDGEYRGIHEELPGQQCGCDHYG